MANQESTTKKQGGRIEVNQLPKSGQPVTAEGSVGMKQWGQLVAQVWADGKLKKRLLANPAAVLSEHGIEAPAGVEIQVVENTDDSATPAMPVGAVTGTSAPSGITSPTP